MTATISQDPNRATIPRAENKGAQRNGTRIAPPPRGTIKRSVTVLCSEDEARQAWRDMKYPTDATFSTAPGDQGTMVTVVIQDGAPSTALGSAVEMLMRTNPADAVEEALRHFREQVETGEIPSTDGQPSGKRS